jgi:hypothetical protein
MRFRALLYMLIGAALVFRACGAIGDAAYLGWRAVAPISTGQGARTRHPTDSEAQAFNVRANHEFERAALLLVIAGGAFWAFGGEWRRRKRQGAGNRSTDAVQPAVAADDPAAGKSE